MQPNPAPGEARTPARLFKPGNRQTIEKRGYRIILNIGDQASDLAGCCAERVFKLPNPFSTSWTENGYWRFSRVGQFF